MGLAQPHSMVTAMINLMDVLRKLGLSVTGLKAYCSQLCWDLNPGVSVTLLPELLHIVTSLLGGDCHW